MSDPQDKLVTVTLSQKDASLVAMTLEGAALRCGNKKPTGSRDWFTRLAELFWAVVPDANREAGT